MEKTTIAMALSTNLSLVPAAVNVVKDKLFAKPVLGCPATLLSPSEKCVMAKTMTAMEKLTTTCAALARTTAVQE